MKNFKKLFKIRSDNFLSKLTIFMPVYDFIYSSFRWHKAFLFTFLGNHIIYYSTPANLTYSWSFGSLAGVSLVIQIVSGVFLGMFYTPHVDLAFASVEFIMRDVNHGWLISIHSLEWSVYVFLCGVLSHFTRSVLRVIRQTS
jgi:quinol-cytochrome oxidoreductase complex cytochrome b subunit